MIRSMYTATSGMISRGTAQFDMLAHNLANVATPGFKAQYIRQISMETRSPGAMAPDVQVGLANRYENPERGSFAHTGEPTDLLPEEDAFFTVQTDNEELAYTRNGRMRRLADGTLADANRYPLMGERGVIRFSPTTEDWMVDGEGVVWADGKRVDRIVMVRFPAGAAPRPVGHSIYRAQDGRPPEEVRVGIRQGMYERSNVSAMEEMVRMIEMNRSVESYQKLIVASGDETTGALVRQTGKVG